MVSRTPIIPRPSMNESEEVETLDDLSRLKVMVPSSLSPLYTDVVGRRGGGAERDRYKLFLDDVLTDRRAQDGEGGCSRSCGGSGIGDKVRLWGLDWERGKPGRELQYRRAGPGTGRRVYDDGA